jgi:multidrug resistance efflux pump
MSVEQKQEQSATPTVDDDVTATAEIPLPRTPARTERTYRSTAATEPAARPSRARRFFRGLRTALVVLALLAAAVAGGAYITRDRLAAQAYVELGHAVLTAEPVPVGTTTAGAVTSVDVAPQSEVAAGRPLAHITVTAPDGDRETQVLRSPIQGIVSKVNVPSGGVATPGQPVVTLYDPARLTFEASASVDDLRKLRLGMAASVTARGLGAPIPARLERVVPRVGDSPGGGAGGFTVVFVPERAAQGTVRTLVPGLPFTATVDTRTAPDGSPAVRGAR